MAVTVPNAKTLDPRAIAYIDRDAISHNCSVLTEALGPAALCAVVKADGYGHGASQCARAALDGGASWLAVATPGEALALRAEAIDARLLVMGGLTERTIADTLTADADFVVWREDQVELAVRLARRAGRLARLHVKLDSGMGRLGTRDGELAVALTDRIAGHDRLELAGLMTHFATADERDSTFFDEQLACFASIAGHVKRQHPGCIVHAANSAAVFRDRNAHFDLARCGIAIYGLDPFHGDPAEHGLRPALSLETYVADVKPLMAGDTVGYGRSWIAERETQIAVLPIGYGDGYRRLLSNRAQVIISGQRHPVVGTVSMDNITVDLGPRSGIERGERAVLIGAEGGERVLTEELARQAETINYEITCGLSQRVPRVQGRPAS